MSNVTNLALVITSSSSSAQAWIEHESLTKTRLNRHVNRQRSKVKYLSLTYDKAVRLYTYNKPYA